MKKKFIVLLAILFLIAIPVSKGIEPSPDCLTTWVEGMDEWEQSSDVLNTWVISRDNWEQKNDSIVVHKHKHKKEIRKEKRHHRR